MTHITEYHIPSPDTLEQLRDIVKDGDIIALKKVWQADRNQHSGHSKWDGDIRIRLVCTGHSRKAYIVRSDKHGIDKTCATLLYNHSLRFCNTDLVKVHETRTE